MTEHDRFRAARDLLLARRTDLAAAAAAFEWPKLERFNWAIDWFDAIAKGNDAPALHIVEESGAESKLSYAELSRRSSQVANFLAGLGAKRGDRMLLMLGNEAPLWETMLAAIKLGVVVIPATTLLSGPDLADRLARGRVRWVLTNGTGLARVSELPADALAGVGRILAGDAGRGPDGATPTGWTDYRDSTRASADFTPAETIAVAEPLLEYFTSGTTSKPKLVRHSRQSYPVGHLSTMYWLGLQPGDVHWTISSPGWAKHAWSCFFAPLNAQACVFIYNYSRFSGPAVLDTVVKYGVKTLCAPPTVWRMLIQEDLKAWKTSLREAISAGEPLNPEVIEQVRAAWGLTIRDGFGQTETTAMIGNPPGQPLKSGSMGRPLPGYPVVLLDADGTPGDEGEICIDLSRRPVSLMDGYADDPEKTAEAMRDGHYHTGDVGTRDADGYITYVGRADDVFKASGYRISPFELESALIEHEAVAEAAVVPSPDPVRGFVPKAYVILAPGHAPTAETAKSIFAFLRGRVSPYKMVRRIEFSELPKTISGKIRRVELRVQEKGRPEGAARNEREFLEEQFR
ncbi:MAG: AMP-binding protein [Burkholderiaceae bacterium]|jgi:acetyl-CoA synthetase|nr:AMP-binding protein [Burkholderiales bacterium]MCZ8097123.1 AMP-binding protein [Burkholderiales bacterium]MCZ8337991.1 AMP-binding protein [Burkholderiaceae bacterium]